MRKKGIILLLSLTCSLSIIGCSKNEDKDAPAAIKADTSSIEQTNEVVEQQPTTSSNVNSFDTSTYQNYVFDVKTMPNPTVLTTENYYGSLKMYMGSDIEMLVEENINKPASHISLYASKEFPNIYVNTVDEETPENSGSFYMVADDTSEEGDSLPSAADIIVGDTGTFSFISYVGTEEHNGNLYDICNVSLTRDLNGALQPPITVDVYINRATQHINRIVKQKDASNPNDVYFEIKTIDRFPETPSWVSSAVEDEEKAFAPFFGATMGLMYMLDNGELADYANSGSFSIKSSVNALVDGVSNAMDGLEDSVSNNEGGSTSTTWDDNENPHYFYNDEEVLTTPKITEPSEDKEYWSEILNKEVTQVKKDGEHYEILTGDGVLYKFDYDDFFGEYKLDIDAFVNQDLKG